jgi:ribosomal protein S18 acetylase RimI-like enzyme
VWDNDVSQTTSRYDADSTHFLLSVPKASPPDESPAALNLSRDSEASPALYAVGTIRWTPGISKMSRLAIVKEYRGRGFAQELVKAMEMHASANGAEMVTLHSQESIKHYMFVS